MMQRGMVISALTLAIATLVVPARAQDSTVRAAPSPVFAIKGFMITGENPLGDGETSRALAPFLRSDATIEVLQKATAALESLLRERGFGLYRVALPPQEVGETVRLEIVKFRLAKVEVEGHVIHDADNIRRSVPELQVGNTPNFKRMAVQSALANENPNKQIQIALKESETPDQIDARITVREQRPWNLSASLSNAGTRASGRDRFTVAGTHTNLFNLDHQFTGAYTTSLERAGDVKQVGLSYKAPFYSLGGMLGASYTRSDVVGNFGAFSSTGAGRTWGLVYTAYLPPEGARRSFLTFALDDRLFIASRINGIVIPGQRDRRSRPLMVSYTARTQSNVASWGYNVDLAVNTGGGDGNDLVSYRSEDPRIRSTRFKVLRGGASYNSTLSDWLWSVRGQFQYTPDALISGEQFGLGGAGSVRGTESDRPIAGDKGFSASLEFTSPELAPGLRMVGFTEAGWLGNNHPNGTTKPGSDRVASVGLGLRFGSGPFSLVADYGRIVLGSRTGLNFNPSAPRRGDDRLSLTVSVRF